MTEALIAVVIAVVLGRMGQLYMTYQQSMSYNRDVAKMRRSGVVSVGLGGRRYRGGRAFVAIAIDEQTERVVDALSLQGFTTFARAKKAHALIGERVDDLIGDRDVTGLSAPQRLAARQAAELYRAAQQREVEKTTADTPRDGSEVAV